MSLFLGFSWECNHFFVRFRLFCQWRWIHRSDPSHRQAPATAADHSENSHHRHPLPGPLWSPDLFPLATLHQTPVLCRCTPTQRCANHRRRCLSRPFCKLLFLSPILPPTHSFLTFVSATVNIAAGHFSLHNSCNVLSEHSFCWSPWHFFRLVWIGLQKKYIWLSLFLSHLSWMLSVCSFALSGFNECEQGNLDS